MPQADPVRKAATKKAKELDRRIRDNFMMSLEEVYIPEIQAVIMTEYDIELVGRVTERKSRTNPIFYRDEFEEALSEFEYIEEHRQQIKIITPEVETFNWNQGKLRIIKNILEGTMGTYIEVDEEQYIAMYDKRPAIQPFDKTVPLKERIYLLRLTGAVRRRWQEIYPRENMIRYPFSNTPPIDIFDEANKYVEAEMYDWVEDAIKKSNREIAN